MSATHQGREISEKKKAQRLTSFLGAIVESSEDAIVSNIITGWNQAAERIFGYTAEEAIGQSISILFPRERLSEEPLIIERIRRGERVEYFETIRLRKDGRPIHHATRKPNEPRDVCPRKQIIVVLRPGLGPTIKWDDLCESWP